MARILLAWELGAGAGHLLPLAEAGRELADAGHDCTFVLRDLGTAHTFLDPTSHRLLQAPVFLPHWRADNDVAHTMADLLANIGYRRSEALSGLLAAWRNLYQQCKPDLIVFDHAPTAQAAAHGLGVPSIILARSGFAVPPSVSPLPNLRPQQTPDESAVVQREVEITEILNTALRKLSIPPLQHLGELWRANARILFSIPELDPYGARDDVEYWGPLAHSQGEVAYWPDAAGPKVFAYLRRFPTLDSLLDSLRQANCSTLIHVAGMGTAECARLSGPSLRFVPGFVDLSRVLAESDLVVTHGGSLAASVLLAGKPMLTLPLHLEQHLTSQRVESLGAGLNAPRLAPDGMRVKLRRLLDERAFGESARLIASRHPEYPAPLDGRFAACVEKLVAG